MHQKAPGDTQHTQPAAKHCTAEQGPSTRTAPSRRGILRITRSEMLTGWPWGNEFSGLFPRFRKYNDNLPLERTGTYYKHSNKGFEALMTDY